MDDELFVKIRRSKIVMFPWYRPGCWYFVLVVTGNRQPLCTSRMYLNRRDCLHDARAIHGSAVTVFLRLDGQADEVLRRDARASRARKA